LNKLKSTNIGFPLLSQNKTVFSEFTVGLDNLGFGKFKMFRVDYIRSYQNGFKGRVVLD
jgi:hypothetical protein